MLKLLKKPLFVRILLIILIFAADIVGAVFQIYRWKENGTLISSTHASVDLPGILFQNLMISIVPILIFVIFFLALKKSFADEMYLRVKGKWQWIGVIAMLLCLTGILIYHKISQK